MKMSSIRATRFIFLLTRAARAAPRSTTLLQRPMSTLPLSRTANPRPAIKPLLSLQANIRAYAVGATSGKSQPDLLVDELQELYDVAKDEFEIATDSTDSSTIYAASDRESARDALNQLLAAYSLYTSAEIRPTTESHGPQQTQPDDSGVAATPTSYDPADIKPEVREEVRMRVGQRVRELENAVTVLEERAQED